MVYLNYKNSNNHLNNSIYLLGPFELGGIKMKETEPNYYDGRDLQKLQSLAKENVVRKQYVSKPKEVKGVLKYPYFPIKSE